MMDLSENENELNVNESVIEKDVKKLKNINSQTKNNVVQGNEKKKYTNKFWKTISSKENMKKG